jgi:hypothetical protein
MNRFVWPVQNDAGVQMPPGSYQVKMLAGGRSFTQPLNVLMDPRSAADGVTLADMTEQYEHNMRVRALVPDIDRLLARVRAAQPQHAAGTAQRKALDAVAEKILTQPVRYGKPGLQAHAQYLSSLTARGDFRIGRDAITRYGELKAELNALQAEVDRALGGRSE